MAIKTYQEIYNEAIASGLIERAALGNLDRDQVLNPKFLPRDLPDGSVSDAPQLDHDVIVQVLQLTLKDDAVVIGAQTTESFERDSFQPFLEATKNLSDAARRKKLVHIYRRGHIYAAGHYYALTVDGATAKLTNPLINLSDNAGEIRQMYQQEARGMQVPPQITFTGDADPERFKQIGNNGCNFSAAINAIIQVHKDNLAAGKLDSVLKFLFRTNVSSNPAIVALSDFVSNHSINDQANLRQFLILANAVYAIPDDARDSAGQKPQEQLAIEIQKKFVILSQIYKNVNGIEAISTRDNATSKQERFIDLARATKDQNPAFKAFQKKMQEISFARAKHKILDNQMAILPDTANSFKPRGPLKIARENGELLRLIDDFIANSPYGDRVDSALLNDFFQQKKAEINRILKLDSKAEIKITVDAVDLRERAGKAAAPRSSLSTGLRLDTEWLAQKEARQKADPQYWYTDRDVYLVNKARNHAMNYGYIGLQDIEHHERIRHSGILMRRQEGDDEVENVRTLDAGRFVRNSRGGIVVECMEGMSRTGTLEGSTAIHLRHTIADILNLDHRNVAGQVYPAKILFPFNPSQNHWIVGEIILKKNARGEFSAEISQYNPMRNYSDPASNAFCEEFRRVFNDTAQTINGSRTDITIERPAAVRIGRRDEHNRLVPIQQGDAVSCGVYSAYALHRLKTGNPDTMWNGFPYDGYGAMTQRIADVNSIKALADSGAIAQASYENFAKEPARDEAIEFTEEEFELTEAEKALIEKDLQALKAKSAPKPATVLPATKKADVKRVIERVTHPKTEAESTATARIEELNKIIAANRDDKELLTALLTSLTGDGDNEEVNYVMAANLIAAGAQITEAMLDPKDRGALARGGDAIRKKVLGESLRDAMQYELRNEYFLRVVASKSPDEIIALLEKYDIDRNYCSRQDGSSAQHHAAQNPHPMVMHMMVGYNIVTGVNLNPNVTDQDGRSPLMIAALCGNVAAAQALITRGANINLRDHSGMTAHQIAVAMVEVSAENRYTEIAQLIEQQKDKIKRSKPAPVVPLPPIKAEESTVMMLNDITNFCESIVTTDDELSRNLERMRISGKYDDEAIAAEETEIRYYQVLHKTLFAEIPQETLLKVRNVAAQMQHFISNDIASEVDAEYIAQLHQLIVNFQPIVAKGYTKLTKEGEARLKEAITWIAKSQGYPLEKEPAKKAVDPALVSSLPFVKPEKVPDSDPVKAPNDIVAAQDLYDNALQIKKAYREKQNAIAKEERNIGGRRMIADHMNHLTMDRSDFFSPEEIKNSRAAKTQLAHVLITADDLSFQACSRDGTLKMLSREDDVGGKNIMLESSDSNTYVKLAGKFKEIFQPETKNPSLAFQPYFANFGAMYFEEKLGGKKIFNDACLFAANARNCVFKGVDFSGIPEDIFPTMTFYKCSFVDVDFSKMPVRVLIYMKMFDDKFDNCTFENCKFPKGIKIGTNSEFILDGAMAKEVESTKAKMAPIKEAMEKIKELEADYRKGKKDMSNEERIGAIRKRFHALGDVREKLDVIEEDVGVKKAKPVKDKMPKREEASEDSAKDLSEAGRESPDSVVSVSSKEAKPLKPRPRYVIKVSGDGR